MMVMISSKQLNFMHFRDASIFFPRPVHLWRNLALSRPWCSAALGGAE